MLRTWGYRIAALLFLGLFGWVWWASYVGYGLASTAAVAAQRQSIQSRRSARVGSVYYGGRYVGGGGPRFGK
ncbi:MAG TPA: hypothetical protein VM490_17455 [Armatimonadaceae bacterium]|nr:hypothetical protein [Armatimonadaceae bacterium]